MDNNTSPEYQGPQGPEGHQGPEELQHLDCCAQRGEQNCAHLSLDAIRHRVEEILPSVIEDWKQLIRIPSVSAIPNNPAVEKSAQLTAELFAQAGARVSIERAGGAPAVIAHFTGPQEAPTVLLYAHHDVQPEGNRELWHSEPFEPTEREGRLYARGSADDKAGIAAHLAAVRAYDGKLPVNVTVFVEGEEEIGSPSLLEFLATYHQQLRSDVIVIADSANWDVGHPALTISLRGLVDCIVEVSTLEKGLHSGMFGGAVPDALTAMVRLLATLHDDQGNVAVKGIIDYPAPETTADYSSERLKNEAGILDGVELIGSGPIAHRLWFKPSITVLAIESVPVDHASNTLTASTRAKISMRVPPGMSADVALQALQEHLLHHSHWKVNINVIPGTVGASYAIDANGPYYHAAREALSLSWGINPVDMGIGGSIPFVAEFAEIFPNAAIIVTGVEDPYSAAHGPNESIDMTEFTRVCLAEALLLTKIGATFNETSH